MPRRKAKYTQRKGTKTKQLANKATEIAHDTPRQALELIIEDIETQVPRLIETMCRKYERECNKALRQLPDKSCLPNEIYTMAMIDFIESGGTVEEAMKTIRERKREEFGSETSKKHYVELEAKSNSDPTELTTAGFKTPALRTRSQLRSTQVTSTAVKRKPNQLEEVKMIAMSKATGSPVDERLVMETLIDGMVQGVMKSVLPKLSSKTAKAQATKAIEQSLIDLKADIRLKPEVSLVTPSLGATGRKRRVRK